MARKKFLRSEQSGMSSSAYVEKASDWSHKLTLAESRGPGDYDNAMRRVANRLANTYAARVTYRALWALRYRPPKRVDADVYEPLRMEAEPYEAAVAKRYSEITARISRLEEALRQERAERGG